MADTRLQTAEPVEAESDRHLRKALTFQELFFLCMGGIIGSGWLLATIKASHYAGPAVILSWIIGGILILFVAMNYAELSGMLPRTGAIVRYPHLTHGSYAGFILAWSYFLTAVTVPVIEAEAVIPYASNYIPGIVAPGGILVGWGIVLGIALTIVFFLLNYFGIKFLGRFNTVITWWKFIIPTLTFLLLFFAFKGKNFTAYGFAPLGTSPIFLALANSGIVFAYLGFRQALDYGGEARNPQKDVPRATILSVIVATILYTLLQITFIGALNWGNAGVQAGNWASLLTSPWANAPLYHALNASGIGLLGAFSVLLLIDAWISPAGTGAVYAGTAARTIYGIAVDNYLPAIFKRVNEKTGIPVFALIASTIIGWLVLLPVPSWYQLVGFITDANVLTYIMGGLGLMVLRRTAPELHRPYKLGGAQILAPIGFIAAAMVVYWSGTATLNGVIAAVFIGLPLYAWFYAGPKMGVNPIGCAIAGILMLVAVLLLAYFGPFTTHQLSFLLTWVLFLAAFVLFSLYMWFATTPDKRHEIWRAAWFIALVMGLYLLGYFTSFGPSKNPPIPFPLDTLIAVVFSLIMFYCGVYSGYKTPEISAIITAYQPEGVQTTVEDPGGTEGTEDAGSTGPAPA
ncbi:APC family permease [Ktedonosporobacter rubrisoli]|uniref:APC family permease n=1 Tax=Ktedonosporobacter rubrisoli TaxID=2509675 RepID=A0A4P6JMI7_KTERU|nr:APC family permease [Ktedonosporobacter rubrisoli]QBD76469.1 APC family permease [Ktedonosporobacter rubrisoli]